MNYDVLMRNFSFRIIVNCELLLPLHRIFIRIELQIC